MPKPRTDVVEIYTGDYLGRIRHLEREYAEARDVYERAVEDEEKAESVRRIGSVPESVALKARMDELAAEHDALVAEARDAMIVVRLTTVRRRKYRELADAHPPRDGNTGDKTLGINALTFREALVPEAIVEVTEDGTTKAWSDYSEAEREDFLDTLAESDMERLFGTAYGLVNGFMADPKTLASHSSQQTPENAAS